MHREEGSIVDALDLDTPALYVDLDVLERNIHQMQEQCRAWGVELRPQTSQQGGFILPDNQIIPASEECAAGLIARTACRTPDRHRLG